MVCKGMTHARRYLFEAFEKRELPIAEVACRCIQDLDLIEREITGKSAQERLAVRQGRRSDPCGLR